MDIECASQDIGSASCEQRAISPAPPGRPAPESVSTSRRAAGRSEAGAQCATVSTSAATQPHERRAVSQPHQLAGAGGAAWDAGWPGSAQDDSTDLDAEMVLLMDAAAARRPRQAPHLSGGAEAGPSSRLQQRQARAAPQAVRAHPVPSLRAARRCRRELTVLRGAGGRPGGALRGRAGARALHRAGGGGRGRREGAAPAARGGRQRGHGAPARRLGGHGCAPRRRCAPARCRGGRGRRGPRRVRLQHRRVRGSCCDGASEQQAQRTTHCTTCPGIASWFICPRTSCVDVFLLPCTTASVSHHTPACSHYVGS